MIYELKNGKFTAQVDSYGAQLASLKGADGTEYLWVGDPAYWREHAPVLFPIVGALRENKAKIHGEWVEMNRHGFAKRSEFAVKEQREDISPCGSPPMKPPGRYIPSTLPSPWPIPSPRRG